MLDAKIIILAVCFSVGAAMGQLGNSFSVSTWPEASWTTPFDATSVGDGGWNFDYGWLGYGSKGNPPRIDPYLEKHFARNAGDTHAYDVELYHTGHQWHRNYYVHYIETSLDHGVTWQRQAEHVMDTYAEDSYTMAPVVLVSADQDLLIARYRIEDGGDWTYSLSGGATAIAAVGATFYPMHNAEDGAVFQEDYLSDTGAIYAAEGIVWGTPMTLGKSDVLSIVSDGGENYVTYGFAKGSTVMQNLESQFDLTAYVPEDLEAGEVLTIEYSFDGDTWIAAAEIGSGATWQVISVSVEMAEHRTIYWRIGGATSSGGGATLAVLDGLDVTFDYVAPTQCGDYGTIYLATDFNKDCYVDLLDLAMLAHDFLGEFPADVFYVSDYIDDNAADGFQMAINAAASYSVSHGDAAVTVHVPAGEYLLDKTIYLRSNITLRGEGSLQSVLVQDNGFATLILADRNGADWAENITMEDLGFVLAMPGRDHRQFAVFELGKNITVQRCRFNSQTSDSLYGGFHQLDFNLCDGVTCVYNEFRNAVAGTGMNGIADSQYARNGYFAYNYLETIWDTGIGMWTGANNNVIAHNTMNLGQDEGTGFCVGIDNDGGFDNVMEYNTISGGQIGIRLMDVHYGIYPITNDIIRHNHIYGQFGNTNGNPASCVKMVHSSNQPDYDMDVKVYDNQFGVEATGIMMWGYTARGGDEFLSIHIDGNHFYGDGTQFGGALIPGGYSNNGQYIITPGSNTFDLSEGLGVSKRKETYYNNPNGNPTITFTDAVDPGLTVYENYNLTMTAGSRLMMNIGTLEPGIYGVVISFAEAPGGNSPTLWMPGVFDGYGTLSVDGNDQSRYHFIINSSQNVSLELQTPSEPEMIESIEIFRIM